MSSTLSQDKWIGLMLAISSSAAIGTSFIITKKGLIDASEHSAGPASEQLSYLQNPIWWAGMATMVVGEVANFIAYTFAPPILVTPLGALSVLIGAVLASFVLKERLGQLGKIGCALCLIGTVVIVVNAPEDRDIQTVEEILAYAMNFPFLLYCVFVGVFSTVMIWKVVPTYGRKTPLVYLSICSLVGSISVMSVKAFGVALKLTFNGKNQLTHVSTYLFGLVVVLCILVQMNYFNRALDQFDTNVYVARHTLTQRQPDLLRHVHHLDHLCLGAPLPGLQHGRRRRRVAPRRLLHHLPRRIPAQHQQGRRVRPDAPVVRPRPRPLV